MSAKSRKSSLTTDSIPTMASSTASSTASSSSTVSSSVQQTSPSLPKKRSRTYRIAVLGYCSSFAQQHSSKNDCVSASAGGAGKSCMCQRMVNVAEDDYRPNDHASVLNLTDFAGSPVINNEHFLYWGCARRYTEDGRECCFEIIEHTEFVDDSTFQPHRTGKTELYNKRSTRLSHSSPGKLQYFGKNQLGIEQEYPQNLMLRDGDKAFNIDGFIICYDVSAARANITPLFDSHSCSAVSGAASAAAVNKSSTFSPQSALPASCAEQSELVVKLLQTIYKHRRPVVVATTKNDEQHKPLAKDAEKLVGRKEFKGGIPLIETSAHRAVNISAAFMVLAQLIDRLTYSSSSAPSSSSLFRSVPYADACKLQGEKLAMASGAFDGLIRSLPLTNECDSSASSYEAAKVRLEKEYHFRNYVELFGETCARRKIEQHLHVLRDRQAQLRAQQHVQELRAALPKIMPDVRVYTDFKSQWSSWQECIKSLPTYPIFFYKDSNIAAQYNNAPEQFPHARPHQLLTAPSHHHSRTSSSSTSSSSPATAAARRTNNNHSKNSPKKHVVTVTTPPAISSRHSSLSPSASAATFSPLPESILYHPDADRHFQMYVDVASARMRHIYACECFMRVLSTSPYVVPGRSLRDVLLYLYHHHQTDAGGHAEATGQQQVSSLNVYDDEQFADLGDDKKLELYAAYQRQLIERAKADFKEFMWENIDTFVHVLLVMPQRAALLAAAAAKRQRHRNKNTVSISHHRNRKPTNVDAGGALVVDASPPEMLPPTSLYAETDMIDSLLASVADATRYRALDYLPTERERMLDQHVWLLRSSMPEACPGPLTYCADLYCESLLDIGVPPVASLYHEENFFSEAAEENLQCNASSPDNDAARHHELIVIGGSDQCADSFMKRLQNVLLPNVGSGDYRMQLELDDGMHTITVSQLHAKTNDDAVNSVDNECACYVYVYDDYESLKNLFHYIHASDKKRCATSTHRNRSSREALSVCTDVNSEFFPPPPPLSFSPMAPNTVDIRRRRLALVVFDGPFMSDHHRHDGSDESDAEKAKFGAMGSAQEFFKLFQLGVALAEQLGCIFGQLVNASSDGEIADQQLLTSLQSLLHEHSMRRRRRLRRILQQHSRLSSLTKLSNNIRRGTAVRTLSNGGSVLSASSPLAAPSSSKFFHPTTAVMPSSSDAVLTLDDCSDVCADLHIRLCFMCGDMLATRHVLLCLLRFYFCSRIVSGGSSNGDNSNNNNCHSSGNTKSRHHRHTSSSVSSTCSMLGGADFNSSSHASLDAYHQNQQQQSQLHGNIAPRSIAFDVYLPAAAVASGTAGANSASYIGTIKSDEACESLSTPRDPVNVDKTNNIGVQQQQQQHYMGRRRSHSNELHAFLPSVNNNSNNKIYTSGNNTNATALSSLSLASQRFSSSSTASLATAATSTLQRKRYRVHLHFISCHEVLRQLCCSVTSAAGAAHASSTKKDSRKNNNNIKDSSNCYVSSQPIDGYILVYNAARRASYAMTHALGLELLQQSSGSSNNNILLSTPPVMMLAISADISGWSETETALIKQGSALCVELQGRWLTCSLLDPIPKIAFDNFWKSCWDRRNSTTQYYEAASTATVHSSMNSSVNSLGGGGYFYASPAMAKPSVSEQPENDDEHQAEDDDDFAVENPTYGTCEDVFGVMVEQQKTDDDDDDDDEEEEDEDHPSAETVVGLNACAAIHQQQPTAASSYYTSDSADDLLQYHSEAGQQHAAQRERSFDNVGGVASKQRMLSLATTPRFVHAPAVVRAYSDDNSINPESGSNMALAAGGRRLSRTEALRSKFESEALAKMAGDAELTVPATTKTPVPRQSEPLKRPTVTRQTQCDTNNKKNNFHNNNKRFSANFSSLNITTGSSPPSVMSASSYNAAPPAPPTFVACNNNASDDAAVNVDNDDDGSGGPPPPLPGRLRNSSKYAAIMGQLNDNIQHQHRNPVRLSQTADEENGSSFDLAPSQPGGGTSSDAKKKKKRKPPSVMSDQADGFRLVPKITIPFIGVASSSSHATASSRRPSLLDADAACWNLDGGGGGQASPVQLLSVKGLHERRGSDQQQPQQQKRFTPPAVMIGGKVPQNARFVLPPMSPRQIRQDELAPLSPASVLGGAENSAKAPSKGLFGGDSRLRKSFDSKKSRSSLSKKDHNNKTPLSEHATANIVPAAETYEELAQSMPDKPLPKFIELCIEFIENVHAGMDMEGLYRIPGNRPQALRIMADFYAVANNSSNINNNNNLKVKTKKSSSAAELEKNNNNNNCCFSLPADTAVTTVCTALKIYLNERTPPLLPKRLVDALVSANFSSLSNTKQKVDVLHAMFRDMLSKANYAVLRYIATHLYRVGCLAHVNSMPAKNLSICWWPTMCRLDVPDMFEFERVRSVLEDVVHVMIEQVQSVFDQVVVEPDDRGAEPHQVGRSEIRLKSTGRVLEQQSSAQIRGLSLPSGSAGVV